METDPAVFTDRSLDDLLADLIGNTGRSKENIGIGFQVRRGPVCKEVRKLRIGDKAFIQHG